jgi:hypothetical protein
MKSGVELIFIDSDHERGVGILSGRRDNDALRAGFEVLSGLLTLGVSPGRFGDHVDFQVSPGQVFRARRGQYSDLTVADEHRLSLDVYGFRISTVNRVSGEESCESVWRAEIVDRYHFKLWVESDGCAKK